MVIILGSGVGGRAAVFLGRAGKFSALLTAIDPFFFFLKCKSFVIPLMSRICSGSFFGSLLFPCVITMSRQLMFKRPFIASSKNTAFAVVVPIVTIVFTQYLHFKLFSNVRMLISGFKNEAGSIQQ